MRLAECVDQTLRVVGRDDKPATQFDLLSSNGRAGSLDLRPTHGLVGIECAEGMWSLRRRQRRGWQFVIESSNDQHVGWYSGRKWLPGGTIDLTDGTQVALARSLTGRWRLRDSELTGAFAYLRSSGAAGEPKIVSKIAAVPTAMKQFHLVVLIACGVVLLEKTLRVPALR